MKVPFACFSLALLFLVQPILAQQDSNQFLIQEYVKQSERQKKTGLVMLGAGLGATIVGAVMIGSAFGTNSSETVGNVGGGLLVAGSLSTLISIPVLISSAANGCKAGKLSISLGQTQALRVQGIPQRTYPTISFSLPLNAQKR